MNRECSISTEVEREHPVSRPVSELVNDDEVGWRREQIGSRGWKAKLSR